MMENITNEYLKTLSDKELVSLGIDLMIDSLENIFDKNHQSHINYDLLCQELKKRNLDATKS